MIVTKALYKSNSAILKNYVTNSFGGLVQQRGACSSFRVAMHHASAWDAPSKWDDHHGSGGSDPAPAFLIVRLGVRDVPSTHTALSSSLAL